MVRYRKQRLPIYLWVSFILFRVYDHPNAKFCLRVTFAGLSPQDSYGDDIGELVDGWKILKIKRSPIKKELRKLYGSYTGNT